MKKLLVGAMALLLSFGANATTISMHDVEYNGSGNSSAPTVYQFDNYSTGGVSVGAATVGSSYTVGMNFESDTATSVNLQTSLVPNFTNTAWTTTIYDEAAKAVATVSNGSFAVFDVVAGATYRAVMSGFVPGRGFTASFSLTAADVSEVPVPAAVWLFGSALMGGFGFMRRNRKKFSKSAQLA